MGWIISAAMVKHCKNLPSLPEQVAESLAGICLDGEQSAPLSGNHTPQVFLSQDKMKAFSRRSRYGMTCKLLTDDRGEALLTSYLAGFPVKTSASQVKAQALTASVQECGDTWHELSVKFDRDSCSWKTHQCLFTEELPESSVTFPKWGMIRDGVLWELTTSERHTKESESGYWPTPCLPGNGGSHGKAKMKRMLWPTPTAHNGNEMDVVAYPNGAQRERNGFASRSGQAHAFIDASSTWWGHDPAEAPEPRLGRMAHGVPDRVHRLTAIGNAQVPFVAAAAFRYLSRGLL